MLMGDDKKEQEVNVTEIENVSDVISPNVTINDISIDDLPG